MGAAAVHTVCATKIEVELLSKATCPRTGTNNDLVDNERHPIVELEAKFATVTSQFDDGSFDELCPSLLSHLDKGVRQEEGVSLRSCVLCTEHAWFGSEDVRVEPVVL